MRKLVLDERNLIRIKKHLEDEAAQARVRHNIQRGRNEVTVTIGRAASLFGFSESQLRDWEKIGLLRPGRPKEESEVVNIKRGGHSGHGGQRQYSFAELDKLALIRELLDEAKFTPGAIPSNIDEIWRAIADKAVQQVQRAHGAPQGSAYAVPSSPVRDAWQEKEEYIDRRITDIYREKLGWRIYTSRALMLSLLLVYEDVPGSYAGLVLPANPLEDDVPTAEKMPAIGEALIGWLGQTRSFYTFLTSRPAFEYPSDYRIVPLCPPGMSVSADRRGSPESADRTLIVVQREDERHVNRSDKAVRTVRRLLTPIYADKQNWQLYFGGGMRDLVNPGIDFTPKLVDALLTGLANIVIQLGGKHADDMDRWDLCFILLPDNQRLPLRQRSLIVRAASDDHRRLLGVTVATPERYGTSLTLRAYQSGHIMYRSELTSEDTTMTLHELEGPIRSNMAVPIGGEMEEPQGVLYVASHSVDAFDEDDQRVLRVMTRIVVDLLNTYRSRQQMTTSLPGLLEDPGTVDVAFKEFLSENEFLRDITALLTPIKERLLVSEDLASKLSSDPSTDLTEVQEISFIGIDLDLHVQETIASSYGDQTLARLNKALGLRIHDLLPAFFMNYADCKLYHIYAGRYYIFLRDFSLEKTKTSAERLRKGLSSPITIKQSELSSSLLTLPDVSVHAGVTWYSSQKLAEFLHLDGMRSPGDVSSTIYHALDFVLKMGADIGGNIVFAWDPITRTCVPYQPTDEELRKD